MDNRDQLRENIKVIKTLREQYKKSRIGSTIEEEKRVWAHIVEECQKRSINPEVILMDDDVFNMDAEMHTLNFMNGSI